MYQTWYVSDIEHQSGVCNTISFHFFDQVLSVIYPCFSVKCKYIMPYRVDTNKIMLCNFFVSKVAYQSIHDRYFTLIQIVSAKDMILGGGGVGFSLSASIRKITASGESTLLLFIRFSIARDNSLKLVLSA